MVNNLFTEKSPMSMLPTENLIPGMLLAADVRDRNGRLLLKAGAELTEKHLYIMRTWGIVEVEIVDVDGNQQVPAGAVAIDPELWAGILAEITPIFRHSDLSHPAIKELLRIRIVREARNGNR
jgi:hypothetical protein